MDKHENKTPEEQFDYFNKCLDKIRWYIGNLKNRNSKLKARNEELEKENEKLRETIFKMSQEKC